MKKVELKDRRVERVVVFLSPNELKELFIKADGKKLSTYCRKKLLE